MNSIDRARSEDSPSYENKGVVSGNCCGWTWLDVVTLDKDLTISTPEGYNWLTQDELENTYDACKEGACNFKP